MRRALATGMVVAAALMAASSGATWGASGVTGACGHEACLESRLMGGWAWRPGVDASGRVELATGRDMLNYPPDRAVDCDHMQVRLFIPDMNEPVATAVQTLTFSPIAGELASLTLDAVGLEIAKVELAGGGSVGGGRTLAHEYDGLRLTVRFDPPLPAGEAASIVTTYTIRDPRNGLIWTPETPDWPGRPAQIHTQGEPQTASCWFPCHDFPNEKLTTEMVVTVPDGFIVSSNGRLVLREPIEFLGKAFETFSWLQDEPHTNYLVTLVVGKFDVVDVGTGGLPMPVYVPPGRGGDVEATYGKTAEMVEFFERRLDEPYPWDQYAQLVVWNFGWGGMENTSATTMYDTAILSPEALVDFDLEGLISHELAHQWFGDLVTCNSWEHIWLNEGFATYLTALWFEHSRGVDDYQASIRGNFDSVIGAATGSAPETPAMVSKVWGAPWETFRRQNNPYPHGASILHMLRQRLGDEAFFAGVALYLDRMKFQSAETGQLRRAMEDVSGESLERFFWQWCERPGVPRLDVRAEWDSAERELVVRVDQTQTIDGWNPAYAFSLPVWLGFVGDGGAIEWEKVSVDVDQRTQEARIVLVREPAIVAVDPEMSVLAEVKLAQPVERWVAQLEHGPTMSARVMAARALGAMLGKGSLEPAGDARRIIGELTQAVIGDDHDALRTECVRSLARCGDVPSLVAIAEESGSAAVRVAAIAAIPDAQSVLNRGRSAEAIAEIEAFLTQQAVDGDATTVRAAAIRAMGSFRAGSVSTLRTLLTQDSQDDAIRQAALDALASLNDPAGLALATEYTHPRVNSRTRASAIGAVVKLAHHDPDSAFDAVAPLLRDRQRRAFLAAGQGLVDLGDERGLEVLRSLRREVIDPDTVWSLDSWIAALEAKVAAQAEAVTP